MELNYNSFSSKLYRWVYSTEKMPQNLCPYFWKLLVAWGVSLPLLCLTFPYEIMNRLIFKENSSEFPIPGRIFLSFVIVVLLAAVIALLSAFSLFWGWPPEDTLRASLVQGGLFLWMIAIIVGITLGLIELQKKRKEKREEVRESKDNLIVEFVKAKYHKYCPQITWKNTSHGDTME